MRVILIYRFSFVAACLSSFFCIQSASGAMCKDANGTIIVNEEPACSSGQLCRAADRTWSVAECEKQVRARAADAKERADQEAAKRVAAEAATKEASDRDRDDQSQAQEPWIGMPISEVRKTEFFWGVPDKKNVTINSTGRHEQWVYHGHRYLYFDNGVLTAVQEHE